MKKCLVWILAILLCLPLLTAPAAAKADDRYLEINASTFPDENFREWVINNLPVSFHQPFDGYYMTEEQIDSVVVMSPSDQGIKSLKGIEYFHALRTLYCGYNELTELDLRYNPNLTYLECECNQLSTLHIEYNNALTYLDCSDNPLGKLDLSPNQNLSSLFCGNCMLRSLDVTVLPELQHLVCTSDYESEWCNELKTLDLSANTGLYYLDCGFCGLTSLDVHNNKNLHFLTCYGNGLKTLDVRSNSELLALNCTYNQLSSLDVSKNGKLKTLTCVQNLLTALDVRSNADLETLECSQNYLQSLDVSGNSALSYLECDDNNLSYLDLSHNLFLTHLSCSNWGEFGYEDTENHIEELDVSQNPLLEVLAVSNCFLTRLDLSNNEKLEELYCERNQFKELDLSNNKELHRLVCSENLLGHLELDGLPLLEDAEFNDQLVNNQKPTVKDGKYVYDLTKIVPKDHLNRVRFDDTSISFNKNTGLVTLSGKPDSFIYRYRVLEPDDGDIVTPELPGSVDDAQAKELDEVYMYVTVQLNYDGSTLSAFDGTIEWNAEDVKYKGTTPYVIENGKAQTPRFTVKDRNGNVVSASNYTYVYRENKNAGTGYVIVTFNAQYSGSAQAWFKIYLRPTATTTVENVKDGIKLTWDPVEGAAGYVIYRRAWSSTTGGWTTFSRWNNTTSTTYLDGADANHRVFAGTRYQYGVKAYFKQRTDPVTGTKIGGNVGDNFNLGEVGPLKTTVRITTRTLSKVTGGSKQLTVKWDSSKVFTGYQIQIATDKNFTKNTKVVKIETPATAQTVIKSLKAKTTYYVRVRSYHLYEGMNYYGEWSNVLSAKTK